MCSLTEGSPVSPQTRQHLQQVPIDGPWRDIATFLMSYLLGHPSCMEAASPGQCDS